jgi:hypothetical protein
MPLLVNSVPNLAQGVSQQPDNLRYPGQCDEQINAWATVVEGLVKRPHTSYIKNVDSSQPSNLFTHFVKREETNKYVINVSVGGSVSAFNLSLGTSIPVATTSIAQAYLSGITNPAQELRALTVADYTFLVNKSKTVAVNTDEDLKSKDVRNDKGKYQALVFVKLGDYEKRYDIYLDGKVIESSHSSLPHLPSSSFVAGHTYESATSPTGEHADTEYIADHLEQILKTYLSSDTRVDTTTLTGGSGWADTSKAKTGKGHIYNTYEYFVDQYDKDYTDPTAVQIGFGAQGTIVFSGGSVQSSTLTHKGTGYDGTLPNLSDTFKLTIRKSYQNVWYHPYIFTSTREDITEANAASYGVTMPTFTASPLLGTEYEVEREGAVIKITNNKDFSVRTEDGLANQGLGVAYKEVDSITDLPKRCFHEFRIKVRGDADIDQDDYYVRFQTKDKEDYGEGSWVETVGWQDDGRAAAPLVGIDTTIDPETMPVTIVPKFNGDGSVNKFIVQTPNELVGTVENNGTIYNLVEEHVSTAATEPGSTVDTDGDGVYDWQEYWVATTEFTTAPDWEVNKKYINDALGYISRQAGDDATNPFPSFVGQTINDIFFFKNRLGFLTNNAVIFSEADAYFNFFRTTTQQLLDSAPIDVGLSHTKVAVLQHAIPFQEKLMLFSKQSQFVLRGADILSPKTVAISPVTEYDISDSINPLAVGNYIYFTFQRNDYEGVYEYFVDNNTETFNAEEITQQIPKYINKKATRIVGSPAENTLVITTDDDLKTLFVYKYFWSNKEKIQSAWMKFTFDRDIVGCDFIDSKLFMLTSDTEGLHLESLTLEDGLKDSGLDYTLYLDSRVEGSTLTTSYDATTKKTTISGFPYDPADVDVYSKIGHKYNFVKTTSTAGEVTGDITSVPFFVGKPYNMLYRFSDQTLKQPTERGGRSASDYTYQTIRSGSLDYADTGHFTVEVTPKYRDTYSYAFNPDIVGANLSLNEFTPQNGHFRFAVQAQPNEVTIEVKSSSALPVKILAAEFESMFIPRSRRYGS